MRNEGVSKPRREMKLQSNVVVEYEIVNVKEL